MIAHAMLPWASVPPWILLVLGSAAALRIARGGAGAAVTELSKANEVLSNRNHELGGEVRDLRIKVAELEVRTDYQAVMDSHERHAQQRFEEIVTALTRMGDALTQQRGGTT